MIKTYLILFCLFLKTIIQVYAVANLTKDSAVWEPIPVDTSKYYRTSLERRFFKKRLAIPDCEVFVNRIAGPLGLHSHGLTAMNCCDKGFWNKYVRSSNKQMIKCDVKKSHILEINLRLKLSFQPGHYIPPEISLLKQLVKLDVSHNALGGNIPQQLGDMTSLKVLNLQSNLIRGEIPTTLGRLTHVEMLALGRNGLTGSIPTELSHLTHIREMSFQDNYLDVDPIPSFISNLQHSPRTPRIQVLPQFVSKKNANAINKKKLEAHMTTLSIDSEHECAICLEKMTAGQLVLTGKLCGHQFHGDCASTWIVDRNKKSCPLCRRPLL